MTVGWYVHHHGAGHAQRLAAVRPRIGADVTVFSSLPGLGGVTLPLDVDDEPARDPRAGETLHWAPLGVRGLSERMAAIAAWIAEARPSAFVVDVSVEVALLVRLLGVPVVYVLQRGRRTDAPHRMAYAQASAALAPWTAATHAEDDYPMGADRVDFTGAISRFDGREREPAGDGVLLLLGAGGHGIEADDVRAAARATPGTRWHVAGGLRVRGPEVVDHGPGADVADLLCAAGVVVGSAGGNVVAEVAAARRPYVCLPQSRPFGEQERQADALRRLGVAEVWHAWPEPSAWPGVLDRARQRDTSRWAQLHDGRGAERFARTVERVAAA